MALRRAVGYVPQDTFLFSETLRENVAFGVDSATDEEIHNAADVASNSATLSAFADANCLHNSPAVAGFDRPARAARTAWACLPGFAIVGQT